MLYIRGGVCGVCECLVLLKRTPMKRRYKSRLPRKGLTAVRVSRGCSSAQTNNSWRLTKSMESSGSLYSCTPAGRSAKMENQGLLVFPIENHDRKMPSIRISDGGLLAVIEGRGGRSRPKQY